MKYYRSWLMLQGELSGIRCTYGPDDLLRHIEAAETHGTYVRLTLECGEDSIVSLVRPSAILRIQPIQETE